MSRSDRDMEKLKRAAAPTPAFSHEQAGKMDKVEIIACSGKIGSLNDPNKAENAMLFALERLR